MSKAKATTLTVKGSNIHGPFEMKFRSPANGRKLSIMQQLRWRLSICPDRGCDCGGEANLKFDEDSEAVVVSIYALPAWQLREIGVTEDFATDLPMTKAIIPRRREIGATEEFVDALVAEARAIATEE